MLESFSGLDARGGYPHPRQFKFMTYKLQTFFFRGKWYNLLIQLIVIIHRDIFIHLLFIQNYECPENHECVLEEARPCLWGPCEPVPVCLPSKYRDYFLSPSPHLGRRFYIEQYRRKSGKCFDFVVHGFIQYSQNCDRPGFVWLNVLI